jgi:hypothetical protein
MVIDRTTDIDLPMEILALLAQIQFVHIRASHVSIVQQEMLPIQRFKELAATQPLSYIPGLNAGALRKVR